jgi:hypothetical protein
MTLTDSFYKTYSWNAADQIALNSNIPIKTRCGLYVTRKGLCNNILRFNVFNYIEAIIEMQNLIYQN